jgi:adenylosuccinate synthase
MGVTAVIGLQWGDEGKGKVVDVLCQRADVVVRCQGGANAGHTVVVAGKKSILHLVPSGILTEGTLCLIGNGVAVDLDVLSEEVHDLEKAGISTRGRLLVSRKAHVVLPIHKDVELRREEIRGRHKLDTTKRGIGPCYSDKYARLGVRVEDVLEPRVLSQRIQDLHAAHEAAGRAEPASSIEDNLEYCERHAALLREMTGDTGAILRESISDGKSVILEGSQGFLLDVEHGTYPFVTSCNTGVHGVAGGAGLAPSDVDSIVGVAKAYMTRVGEGPLPTQMEEPYQSMVRERGSEYGATTGRPRRCGWLDLTAIRYSCAVNGVTSVAVTKLDTLSGLDEVKLGVAYEYHGTCVETFPVERELLENSIPRYASNPVWGDVGGITRMEDLPPGASRYVDRILEAAGCGLEFLSVGPGREQLLGVGR